ncbi:Metallo-hydrolase/oxidoreductase [Xylariomycetidae sp. FL2044]|nr:Metallo-hydrolase/oxidoreductase [Xylariomycetidae sp. FL2044]
MSASASLAAVASVSLYTSTVTKGPSVEGDKAHHVKNSSGDTVKFVNPHPSYTLPGFLEIVPMVFKSLVGSSKPNPKLEDKVVPVRTPEFLPTRESPSTVRATWLGHACYYVEYPSGLRVLFDPVFEDCCAPVNFKAFKRYTEPPCNIADIPFIDAVVISHSHYDHLSYPTVQEIQKKHPDTHFFVGLGLEKWFKAGGFDNVTELDWWEEVEMTLTPKASPGESEPKTGEPITAKISCLPCQHSSGRTGFDRDHTLWCSWAVTSGTPAKSVWFGGDTGYRKVPKLPEGVDDYGDEFKHLPVCPQFQQIGEKFGSFDLGLIPIGAYYPRHLFSGMHANPFDAVEIFRDTNCKRAMGIHWGTWVLTLEDVKEPPRLLQEALRRHGIAETGVFDVCEIGETREF